MAAKQKLNSLQALRAIAFLGIFLIHAGAAVNWGKLGVSLFFVLSGFLMVYSYMDRPLSLNPISALGFSISKIKKLYPLHIITMLLACIRPAMVIIRTGNSWASLINRVVLNVLLLQTWVPVVEVNISLNGVAWYFSVCLFLYFCFPAVMWLLKRLHRTAALVALGFCILVLMYVMSLWSLDRVGLDYQFFTWATYCFPVYRLGDFIIGAIAGYLFLSGSFDGIQGAGAAILEFLALFLAIGVELFGKTTQTVPFIRAIAENYTLMFVPVSALLVIVFALRRGPLTSLLDCRSLKFFGDLSPYMFLIHYVVTQNAKIILADHGITASGLMALAIYAAELAITIILSLIYRKLEGLVKGM